MNEEDEYEHDPLGLRDRPKLPRVELQISTIIDFEGLVWVPIIEITNDDAEQMIRDYASAILSGFEADETPGQIRQMHPQLRAVTSDGLIVGEWLNVNI